MPGRKILLLDCDAADREHVNPLLEDGLNAYYWSALSKGPRSRWRQRPRFFGLSTVYRRRGDNQQAIDVRSAP